MKFDILTLIFNHPLIDAFMLPYVSIATEGEGEGSGKGEDSPESVDVEMEEEEEEEEDSGEREREGERCEREHSSSNPQEVIDLHVGYISKPLLDLRDCFIRLNTEPDTKAGTEDIGGKERIRRIGDQSIQSFCASIRKLFTTFISSVSSSLPLQKDAHTVEGTYSRDSFYAHTRADHRNLVVYARAIVAWFDSMVMRKLSGRHSLGEEGVGGLGTL